MPGHCVCEAHSAHEPSSLLETTHKAAALSIHAARHRSRDTYIYFQCNKNWRSLTAEGKIPLGFPDTK